MTSSPTCISTVLHAPRFTTSSDDSRDLDWLNHIDGLQGMTKLDRVSKMPARTLLYGFLGFVAVAGAVTMMSDPLDPEIGNNSMNPSDWSDSKLKVYLSDNDLPYDGDAGRRELVKLVKRHVKAQERARQTESDPLLPQNRPATDASNSAEAENERLMQASNLT